MARIAEDEGTMRVLPGLLLPDAIRYVVIQDGRVVQRIMARGADEALSMQVQAGELAVMVGG